MIAIAQNPITQPPKPREMDLIIAAWLGWTELHDIDGVLYGRNLAGHYARVPPFSGGREHLQLAMEAVGTRGLSFRLRCYLRGVIWFGDGVRDIDNATDRQKCTALVLMISEGGGVA